uniref:Nucleolar protein 8 n=1 Tax=Mandrillus leucophaeus TaxID=9568 RepID=A0A2K5Z4Z9_MANLE
MKVNREMKHLYVGGLGQDISETDLQNQFSRFAKVSDVEIITRKDDQGNPQKIFAYINISVAEADLKKCMSVLNKTKWKGGKEEAKAKKGKSTTGNTNLLEKIGGVEFHMKAVPGYKNWVVSKFRRVLLVLHLKNYHKYKIIKYDPSKSYHNLKKIGEDFTNTVPISSLTWELEGGNYPMREFSDFHSPPKKMIKVQRNESSTGSLTMSPRPRWVIEIPPLTQQQAAQKRTCDCITSSKSPPVLVSDTQKLKNLPFKTSGLETAKKRNSISNDDIDSEDELRMMIAKEENLERTVQPSINESENDPFGVVRDDFKSGVHKLHSSIGLGIKTNVSCHDSDDIIRNDCMTQEIQMKSFTAFSQLEKSTDKKTSFKNREICELSDHCIKSALGHGLKPLNHKSPSQCSSGEDADSASELADSEGDKEKFQMKILRSPNTPTGLHRRRQCICPEDIVASLLEGEESTCGKQKPKENNLKPKFQVFKGGGCLYEKESIKKKSLKDNVASNNINKDQNSMKHVDPSIISMEDGSPYVNGFSGELPPCQHAKKANGLNYIQPQKRQNTNTFESQDRKAVSTSSSEKRSKNSISSLLPLEGKKSLSLSAKTHNIGFDKDSCHSATKTEASEEERSDSSSLTSLEKSPKVLSKDTEEIKTDFSLSISNSSDLSGKDKHAEDDEKHLAALKTRQKAKEVQKKLVYNALTNVDGHAEDKLMHIIFSSDSECETEEISTQEDSRPGEEWVKESMGETSRKLPDSSDDEESDSEDNSNRLKIKPQFEGRAEQKLMDLQSHFESASEEEQEELNEKKTARKKRKALNVVQSVLQINLTAKKFKDSIHDDPTKQDRATYERKRHDKPEESKEKQKKKREEAEKLSEVSKERYHNIAMDLKEIFRTSKYTSEKEADIPWNEECGKEKPEEIQDPAALSSGAEQPSRFTFSFFDSDTKDIKEETHRDPCFQDSSSEGEDVPEGTDHRKSSPGEASLPEKETTRFFFFSKNNEGLQRGAGSNISRNSWDAGTDNLPMDCRKKHKDAKRKMKPK